MFQNCFTVLLFLICAFESFLYTVAEEGGEHDGCSDDEQDGSHHHHYLFLPALFSGVYLEVNLQAGDDGHDSGHRIADIHHIQQHGNHEVMGFRQPVRPPAVIHSAAFGGSGQAADGQDCRQRRSYKVNMSHGYD